jgi:hypothetical protein
MKTSRPTPAAVCAQARTPCVERPRVAEKILSGVSAVIIATSAFLGSRSSTLHSAPTSPTQPSVHLRQPWQQVGLHTVHNLYSRVAYRMKCAPAALHLSSASLRSSVAAFVVFAHSGLLRCSTQLDERMACKPRLNTAFVCL